MSITNQQSDFIQSHGGDLSPEQAASLLDMAESGDTANAENGGVPNITPDDSDLSGDNAVVLARDGKHTIPYEKLAQARDAEKQWRAHAEQVERQLAELQKAAADREAAGVAPTLFDNQMSAAESAIANGVDPDIFGDFSEEALASGIQKLIEQQVSARMTEALRPMHQQEAKSAAQAHLDAIYSAHPDADSIIESQQLDQWISSQPSYLHGAISEVLVNGTTEQIVELFDQFKSAYGMDRGAGNGASQARAAAQAAIAGSRSQVPNSLTDFPAGRAGAGAGKHESMASMNSQDLAETMQSMTPDQIEQFLNRRL